LTQQAVLLLFLSFCVGLIPRKIKSTQNDEEPQKEGRKRRHHLGVAAEKGDLSTVRKY